MARTGRILLVDDEISIQRTLAPLLRSRGYEVEVASNGAEPARDVLEVAMAPEVEPRPAPATAESEEPSEPGAEGEAKPLGEETIESIIADLKRRTEQKE